MTTPEIGSELAKQIPDWAVLLLLAVREITWWLAKRRGTSVAGSVRELAKRISALEKGLGANIRRT